MIRRTEHGAPAPGYGLVFEWDAERFDDVLVSVEPEKLFRFAEEHGPAYSYLDTPPMHAIWDNLDIREGAAWDVLEDMPWGLPRTYRHGREHRMLPLRGLPHVANAQVKWPTAELPLDFVFQPAGLAARAGAHRDGRPREDVVVVDGPPDQAALVELLDASVYPEWDADMPDFKKRAPEVFGCLRRRPTTKVQWLSVYERSSGSLLAVQPLWLELEDARAYMPMRLVRLTHRSLTRYLLRHSAERCAALGIAEISDGDASANAGLFHFKHSLGPCRFDAYAAMIDEPRILMPV